MVKLLKYYCKPHGIQPDQPFHALMEHPFLRVELCASREVRYLTADKKPLYAFLKTLAGPQEIFALLMVFAKYLDFMPVLPLKLVSHGLYMTRVDLYKQEGSLYKYLEQTSFSIGYADLGSLGISPAIQIHDQYSKNAVLAILTPEGVPVHMNIQDFQYLQYLKSIHVDEHDLKTQLIATAVRRTIKRVENAPIPSNLYPKNRVFPTLSDLSLLSRGVEYKEVICSSHT